MTLIKRNQILFQRVPQKYIASYLGVSEQSENNSPFSIYPNPTNDYLFIKSEAEYRFDLQLLNSLSQVILEKKNVLGNQMIDVQELPSGVYYLSTIINHQHFVQPIYIIK